MYQLLLPIAFAATVLGAAGPISLRIIIGAESSMVASNFKTCSRSDPNINPCLKSAIQSALSDLVKGSRPLGVGSVDPLQLTSMDINQGTGPVAIKLNFKDLKISGIGKLVIESVDAHLNGETKSLSLTVRAQEDLSLVGKYTIDGQVLILDISGTGDSRIDLLGVTASLTFSGKTITKNGVKYLFFNNVKLDLNPKSARLHFQNLFNGDKALGDNMNKFLNDNWGDVYPELKSPIETAFAQTFIEICNRIFSKVPEENIFPN